MISCTIQIRTKCPKSKIKRIKSKVIKFIFLKINKHYKPERQLISQLPLVINKVVRPKNQLFSKQWISAY